MEKTNELLDRLKKGVSGLEDIKNDFILQNSGLKSVDDLIYISNVYIKLLTNFVNSGKTDDQISSDEKNKIKIISEHYKAVKKVVEDFSKIWIWNFTCF